MIDKDNVHATLAYLPTSDNAVSEHTLKQMFLFLQKDIYRSISHIQTWVHDLGNRTDREERKFSDFIDVYNESLHPPLE